MKVKIQTNAEYSYVGTNERGQQITISGNKMGVSPMESVLMAAAACSTVDIESLLKKMRQSYSKVEVEVSSTRADAIPAVFTDIHLHYIIYGDAKLDKVEKAVKMSMEQYCSVSIMLKKSVNVTYTVEVRD